MLIATWPPAAIQLVFVIRQACFSMYSKFVYPIYLKKKIKSKWIKKPYYIKRNVIIPATPLIYGALL